MPLNKLTNIIRAWYHFSLFLSVGCTFAGSLFALYDLASPNNRTPANPFIYVGTFGFSLFSATASVLLAIKFQEINIGSREEKSSPHYRYPAYIAPRNWKSNMVEIIFLIYTNALMFVNNYFFLAAIDTTYKSLQDPSGNYPIVPLGTVGLNILVTKSAIIDLPFVMTNEQYSAVEELKEDITDSKVAPLLSKLLKPLTKDFHYNFLLFWIKTMGAMSSVLTNYVGMLLSVPLQVWYFLCRQLNSLWLTIGLVVSISIPLIFVNYIRTLYCQGKESEINLFRIKKDFVFFSDKIEGKSFIHYLLGCAPCLTKPIYYGFYSHSIIHGGNSAMPVAFFLQDFFDRLSVPQNIQTGVVVAFSVLVFFGSLFGTYFTDVTDAIKDFKEDFDKEPESSPVLVIN